MKNLKKINHKNKATLKERLEFLETIFKEILRREKLGYKFQSIKIII